MGGLLDAKEAALCRSGAASGTILPIHGFRNLRPIMATNRVQTYHATMLVTRTEEWCVEAATPEEARALLEMGQGHRCSPGEISWVELEEIL
jgi:hypothetical protein